MSQSIEEPSHGPRYQFADYAEKASVLGADRYGQYSEGHQLTADIIAGKVSFQRKGLHDNDQELA